MNRRTMTHTTLPPATAAIDLALVAQRIIKLAEIATLDHLDALHRSQAVGLFTQLSTTQHRPYTQRIRP